MNRKERVKGAIEREQTDLVPYNIDYTPPVQRLLQRHLGQEDVDEAIGNHILLVSGKGIRPLYADPSEYGELTADDFGVVWRNTPNDRGQVHRHPLSAPSLEGYVFPDPLRPGRFVHVAADLAAKPDVFAAGVPGDLWERAYFLLDFNELLSALHWHPRFVEELLERLTEYDLATFEELAKYPIDAVFMSDDYGHQRGLYIRPEHWRRFIKPRLGRILAAAKERGLFTILHSDGNIVEIIPDLIEIGLDVLHPVQPEAMDVHAIKREFGRELTLWGGIGTQHFLNRASPQEIREEVDRAKEVLGQGGGYILAPSINLQRDVPLENILALIEAARER